MLPDDHSAIRNLEVIRCLCLEAGRIMEKVGSDMALVLPAEVEAIEVRVELLYQAAAEIMTLAEAARR